MLIFVQWPGKVDIQIVFYATVFNVNLILYPIAVVGFKNK